MQPTVRSLSGSRCSCFQPMNGSFAPAFRRNHSNCKRECNGGDLQREVAKVMQSRYWVAAKESCNASHTETTNGQNEETAKHQDESWRPFGVCSDDVGVGAEYAPATSVPTTEPAATVAPC
jgi:hypothetical protein